jgi:hypothetical protein
MFDRNWRRQEGIAGNGAGEEKVALRKKVTQAEQRRIAKFAIILQLLRQRFAIMRGSFLIDNDEIGMKPARYLQSESGVAFFVNGKAVRVFESAPNSAGQTRLVIDEKNFLAQSTGHAFCQASVVPAESKQGGNNVDGQREDDCVEGEGDYAVNENEPPHGARFHCHVGNLAGHTDNE